MNADRPVDSLADILLDALVASEFLKKTHQEAYVLAGGFVR
jgi:hypothetical protein